MCSYRNGGLVYAGFVALLFRKIGVVKKNSDLILLNAEGIDNNY
jgi:hypothetical protein